MFNKTIIRFGFCDIQNNQGLGKGYQPQPSASADNPYLDLIFLDITKTSSNNCLLSGCRFSEFDISVICHVLILCLGFLYCKICVVKLSIKYWLWRDKV